ncbi:MAG: type IV toxin-antitoxin system AbiEi family antitoxin domain-containing protein [Acidimicrobiales bacterium]
MAGPLIVRVLRAAADHHGILPRGHLRGLGCSDHQIARLERIGVLVRAGRGVYAAPGALDSWVGRQAAAQVRASSDLHLAGVRQREGLAATSLERTLVDLGSVVPASTVEAAVDRALRTRSTTVERLGEAVRRHARQGRAGVGVLRRVLTEREGVLGRTDSELERLLLAVIVDGGLALPVTQHVVRCADDRFVARIDMAYPALFVGIEADSERWHSDRARFVADRVRRDRLQALGWRMLGFTWHHVTREPAFVVDTIGRTCELAQRPMP